MKEYLLLFKGGLAQDASPEIWQQHMLEWRQWMDALGTAGKLGGGQQLDQNGRVMRKENDRVIDRPYAETKEIVGGYITVKADTIEEAVELAKDCPIFIYNGTCEVAKVIAM